ncbi:hypothetical protein FA13DRAFT_96908 [Coprinellus micaceus]|uniref:Uncharacterized protein n=1 Tax=Coprinellus micaceus TaxID=71717 RepID=A0A4Y7SIM0_COPMI|nr:hypothetical protein FA13DRAFT_96908 [Coprinellus micaceus]
MLFQATGNTASCSCLFFTYHVLAPVDDTTPYTCRTLPSTCEIPAISIGTHGASAKFDEQFSRFENPWRLPTGAKGRWLKRVQVHTTGNMTVRCASVSHLSGQRLTHPAPSLVGSPTQTGSHITIVGRHRDSSASSLQDRGCKVSNSVGFVCELSSDVKRWGFGPSDHAPSIPGLVYDSA